MIAFAAQLTTDASGHAFGAHYLDVVATESLLQHPVERFGDDLGAARLRGDFAQRH